MGTVLIVEDDGDTRGLYAEVVRELGHQVAEAADGIEALEKLDRDPPTLVVLDLQLPNMNGYDFLAHVRASSIHADLPVIAVSGTATGSYALKAGADVYLQKPFHVDELARAVERFTSFA